MSTKEKETPGATSLEEQIPETKSQQDPSTKKEEEEDSIDPNYVSSLEARLAEQQIQYRRLEKLIEGVKQEKENQPPPPKVRNIEDERNNFYKDPVGALNSTLDERDSKILKQMERMLQPIQKVAASFESDNEYKQLKRLIISQNSGFSKSLIDPDIESVVDNVMGQPGVSMDENTIKSAISQAAGLKSMGMIGTTRKVNNSSEVENRVDPPHIRTNRTRIVKEGEVRKELTEDDRLAMKIAGLRPGNPEDEKQYWDLVSDDTMVLDVHKKKES